MIIKQHLVIHAQKDDCWVTFKIDSQPIQVYILRKTNYLALKGDEIRIFLGNVNATKIFLNNDLISVDSPNGVKSLVFPQENGRKYMLPLFVYPNENEGRPITSNQYLQSKLEQEEELSHPL